MTTTDESHRLRARRAINAARRGHLPKPKASIFVDQPSVASNNDNSDNIFETASKNSIEVYDDKFGRNSILTRSARMRKFKFYQYKPIRETNNSPATPKTVSNNDGRDVTTSNSTLQSQTQAINSHHSIIDSSYSSPQSTGQTLLMLRDNVLQGKVAMISEQSKELCDLDTEISELERKIADLNGGNNVDNLDEIFELVNKKNDLLRRQMQLNILEQEKALEKANEELTKELRSLMSIEDSKKTQAELERQQYLYDQSLALVNRRNELVHHMDVQEKGIDDDNALKATLKTVISDTARRNKLIGQQQNQNCCIQ